MACSYHFLFGLLEIGHMDRHTHIGLKKGYDRVRICLGDSGKQ